MGSDNLRRLFQEQSPLFDDMPVQIWFLVDPETYGCVNQAHADFLGLPKDQVEFQPISKVLPPDLAETCIQDNQIVFDSCQVMNSKELLVDFQEEKKLLSVSKTPKLQPDGRTVDYVVCVGSDITDEATHFSESLNNFRTFIETIEDLVLIGTMDGQVIYSNPAATKKLGFSPEELLEFNILNLHPEWCREEAQQILGEMFQGKRESCPLPLQSKDNRIVPVETRAWLGKWNGQDCIIGLCKDLTKEQELLQKFERLFLGNPAPMAISSFPDRRFLEINKAFLKTLGYEPGEIIGKTTADINLTPNQDDLDQASEMMNSYGSLHNLEMQVKAKDGSLHTGLFSGEFIESQGQKFFLTVMIDITQQKVAEQKLENSIVELKSALEQIKTLQGILPMCSSCKKIRDDKGYWEQVEWYIGRHTDAQFSHGICPDCKDKLYPDLD